MIYIVPFISVMIPIIVFLHTKRMDYTIKAGLVSTVILASFMFMYMRTNMTSLDDFLPVGEVVISPVPNCPVTDLDHLSSGAMTHRPPITYERCVSFSFRSDTTIYNAELGWNGLNGKKNHCFNLKEENGEIIWSTNGTIHDPAQFLYIIHTYGLVDVLQK